jgi:uncharacterized protein (TIGR02246 family)
MTDASHRVAAAIAAALTDAWNAYDGAAFARAFTEDADFVNIFGMHGVGRDAIARNHQMIFDGVYRGSVNRFTVAKVRALDNVILAHLEAELTIPDGPMSGVLRARALAALVRDGDAWKIVSFQNTREQAPPPLAPPHAAPESG